MKLNRIRITAIAAVVVATAYSLSRWRDEAPNAGEQASTTDHSNPTAD